MKNSLFLVLLLSLLCSLAAYEEEGVASWYGGEFQGRLTANGETFDTNEFTAAHRYLPFNSILTVTNLENGKAVRVRVNDRGPFADDRILDLSYAGATAIDMIERGTAKVRIVLENPEILNISFTIHVASFQNLENALAMKRRLEASGFKPRTSLSNQGVTRIYLADVSEEEVFTYAQKLQGMGISDIRVNQN